MVNGQILLSAGWGTSEPCSVVKGEGSPSSSEWTRPASSVSPQGSVDGLDDTKKQIEDQVCRIIVEADSPFKIKQASPAWLELFQFTEREVVGRSFRVCQGPKTDNKKLMHFVKTSDGETETEAVLYSKDGDEISVMIRSGLGNNTDGYTMFMNVPGQTDEMRTRSVHNGGIASAEAVDFVLTTEAADLFAVRQAGVAFTKLCGFPESQLKEEGIGLLIGPGADGIKWKNLLNHGMEGAERECHLRIQSVHGGAIPVRMRVMPRVEGSEKKVTELSFVCVESGSGSSDSSGSFGENSTSPESSSSSFGSSSGQSGWEASASTSNFGLPGNGGRSPYVNRQVMVHLQAMKLAKSKTQVD